MYTYSKSDKIKVLIVDDIAATRENIRRLLQFEQDIEVVGGAGTGREAILLYEVTNPDVVIMDINMPEMDGITATNIICTKHKDAHIIMLSVQNAPEYIRRSMLAGAKEYLITPPNADELVSIIRKQGLSAKTAKEKEIDVDEAMKEAFRLGESVDNGERQEAIRIYAIVLQKSPALGVAWFNTGVIQSRMGNWQEAIRSFSQAQDDPDLRLVTAFAKLKLKDENGQQLSDADFPQEFRGEKRGALGVQGPCHNAANELRNRGYSCTLESKGESCSIHCHTGNGDYIIAVNDLLGTLFKNVYRKEGGKEINLDDVESLSETDQEIKRLEVGRLPIAQAPVLKVADGSQYRATREIAERKVGPHGWVRLGRSFDEVAEQNAADAKRSGIEYIQITSIEHIAKTNRVPGTFLACCLRGEPHALAMPEYVDTDCIPTIKRSVERSACVFRAEFFTQPEYPLVHIGLGLPVKFLEGSKVAFTVVENVANFVEANFQDWVKAIETKRYTMVDVVTQDGNLIASGRTTLEPIIISEIVEAVNKANTYLNMIPQGSQNYKTAVNRFFQQYPDPFIWSPPVVK